MTSTKANVGAKRMVGIGVMAGMFAGAAMTTIVQAAWPHPSGVSLDDLNVSGDRSFISLDHPDQLLTRTNDARCVGAVIAA